MKSEEKIHVVIDAPFHEKMEFDTKSVFMLSHLGEVPGENYRSILVGDYTGEGLCNLIISMVSCAEKIMNEHPDVGVYVRAHADEMLEHTRMEDKEPWHEFE